MIVEYIFAQSLVVSPEKIEDRSVLQEELW